jgi:hypothetical protein
MTASQCTSFENAIGGPAFEYTEHFTNATCSGIPVKIDDADWQAGHSHSWNSSNEPYVETDRKGNIIVANNATTVETGFIGPVDLDIQPASFDSSCTQQITARISSVPNDPDTETEVPIDVTQIDVNTMRVNGVPVVPSTCNLDQSAVPRLSCSLPSCVDGVPVGEIDGSQIHFMATGELFNGGLWASDTETKPFTP